MPCTIKLPTYVFENNIAYLVGVLFEGEKAKTIRLDFSSVRYYIPAGVTLILSALRRWIDEGKKVIAENYEKNAAFAYLQRIDFFKILGLELPETFQRHDSEDFMPLQEIQSQTANVAEISSRVAKCLMPTQDDKDCFQLLEYSCGEIINNCKQHSGGVGYISAQYALHQDFARIAIADDGIGILESFRQNDSPYYKDGMIDAEALELALKPEVSSTSHRRSIYGKSQNRGMGLPMIKAFMEQCDGIMFIASGKAYFLQHGNRSPYKVLFRNDTQVQGTIFSVAFCRGKMDKFLTMRRRAYQELGLHKAENIDNLIS